MGTDGLYAEKTTKSAQLHLEASKWIPGGVTANIKYFDPHPIVMKSASGAYLTDVDHNQYIDYNLCYGALIMGHGHPRVTTAIQEQLAQMGTTIFGTPHQLETEMARVLVDLYPGIETVRFCNSGLESTLLAIRLATAWTGRKKLAKFEGHYHGGYDQVLISVNPSLRNPEDPPAPQLDSRGIPDYYAENTIVLPFNDLEQTAAILKKYRNEIAAVMMEPIQGGYIPPDLSFLRGLRELTQQYRILLIFDEVKTGFRVGLSGAQGRYGVTPDITALGKVLGGGFPVGAVGGKKEIMEMCSPSGGADILTPGSLRPSPGYTNILFHSGTYNGHPTALSAGLATIQALQEPGAYHQLEEHTRKLRSGIEEILDRYGVAGQTVGVGSIFNMVMTDHPVHQVQDVLRSDVVMRKKLDFSLINEGIYMKPLNRFSLSVAHTPDVIMETLERFENGVKKVSKKQVITHGRNQ
ncbi:aspartate aminotransferase family protein [Paenactinomyces guangxiensis]|uniref:Aspartate aminotransferase family protein n=1 Tax=Paenactinomyces guangxiensis TaxID=1490290 RepID=A0A7W1WSB3_9BACL|nr:aspartate aminotransferase family protein [Paenactinomyces guangxiensis]MBA4495158.1 aspartate aminotransferase family protein [Paenactinomyces guangxiensis]MBH8592158.1 aspartate aminotransferase family protein [Paenactinomyces guangxiensis]